MAQHNELGKWGEKKALAFLLKSGYDLVSQNYRYQRDEVDMIMKFKELYIFVEVKTRTVNRLQEPEKAVTKTKQKRIIAVANHYLLENELNNEVRFDVISIVKKQKGFTVRHIENAFMPQW